MPKENVKIYASKLLNDAINNNTTNNELSSDIIDSIDYNTNIGKGAFGVVYQG